MRYRNAISILPEELINAIQQYVSGEYIYIPIAEKRRKKEKTVYAHEIEKRNKHIYTKHLEGMKNLDLAQEYSLSQSSIRRILVTQKEGYKKVRDQIKAVLCNWNIDGVEIKQIYDSAWQIGENYVLKIYDSMNMLERNIRINTMLSNLNVPVGNVFPNNQNKMYSTDKGNYYLLTERLKDNNIVCMDNPSKIGQDMGKIIAELHIAFLQCEKEAAFWENSLLTEMKGWIKHAFMEDGWRTISEEQFQRTLCKLEQYYDKLPVQLIHRDVHFGNFLFCDNSFSGYIDFDLSQRNVRIFDLCYFMLGLLSEDEVMVVTEDQWFSVLQNLFLGYHKTNSLSRWEIKAVPYVMQSIELLFAAWFLKQKDFKCSENAIAIYNFVKINEKKICNSVNLLQNSKF